MTAGNRNTLVFCTLLLYGVTHFVGCQTHEKETAVVRGTVSLDGQPVQKGVVMFVPRAGRSARGVIRSDGTFQMSTYGEGDGAIVGENNVAVLVALGDDATAEDIKKYSLPNKYASPASSGIVCDVKPGEENEVNLKLESK